MCLDPICMEQYHHWWFIASNLCKLDPPPWRIFQLLAFFFFAPLCYLWFVGSSISLLFLFLFTFFVIPVCLCYFLVPSYLTLVKLVCHTSSNCKCLATSTCVLYTVHRAWFLSLLCVFACGLVVKLFSAFNFFSPHDRIWWTGLVRYVAEDMAWKPWNWNYHASSSVYFGVLDVVVTCKSCNGNSVFFSCPLNKW